MAKRRKSLPAEGVGIEDALDKLNCKLITDLSEYNAPYQLTTGIFGLDIILSAKGGLSVGCIELYGGEGVGKSSLALQTMVQAQKAGLKCHYINMERSITESLVACFDLDPSAVNWVEPLHGQAAFNAAEFLLRTEPRSFIVIDSIQACISSAQLEEDANKDFYAPIATLLSKFMPKAKVLAPQGESIIMFLNQLRDNLTGYGPKDIVPGGRAIKFFCDWRIKLRRTKKIKKPGEDQQIIGHEIEAITEKNRSARPFQKASFTLIYGKGFSTGRELLDLGLQVGYVKKGGSWYTIPIPGQEEPVKLQGEENASEYIEGMPEVQEKIKTTVRELIS
jgi:recombination protein RecA